MSVSWRNLQNHRHNFLELWLNRNGISLGVSSFVLRTGSAVNHLRATVNSWYRPYISRAEGAQLLEGCEAGSFILRESSKAGSYALSVVMPNSGTLGHYLVEKRGSECFCLQGSENAFVSVEDLLAHYHHNDSIGLPCRLRLPQRHSSSMSNPQRPLLPALPPRNISRAGSVGSRFSSQPVGRPYPSGHHSGHPSAHTRQSFGHSTPALSPISPTSPGHHAVAAAATETYEDMSGGSGPHARHHSFGHSIPGVSSLCPSSPLPPPDPAGETYEDMSGGSACSMRRFMQGQQEELDGETYEDMAPLRR